MDPTVIIGIIAVCTTIVVCTIGASWALGTRLGRIESSLKNVVKKLDETYVRLEEHASSCDVDRGKINTTVEQHTKEIVFLQKRTTGLEKA